MMLFTKSIKEKLLANGKINLAHRMDDGNTEDFKPVVKLFGGGSCTWLISEIDPENPDIAFGLCDLGMGSPEMGDVYLPEILAVKFPPFGLGVERDRFFTADKTLTEYANEARDAGRIVA